MKVDPELKETIKWGNPVFVKSGDVFYLSATDSYVQFGVFKGVLVEGQMENVDGMGKDVRGDPFVTPLHQPAALLVSPAQMQTKGDLRKRFHYQIVQFDSPS